MRRIFLRVVKVEVLWTAVLLLTMGFPSICGAQMTVKVETLFSTENGLARIESDFRSQFNSINLGGVQGNQYFNDVVGNGGSVTVAAEFKTNGNSEIDIAGLSILQVNKSLRTEGAPMLRAVESIGTGLERPGESFGASGGSEIRVTEVLHSTSGSTVNGDLVYLVQSEGVGQMSAGVAGEFNKECLECETPKTSGKGTMEDLRLQTGVQSESARETLKAGFQRADMHIEFSGQFSGAFQGIIEAPK